jgi:hypothetical protein
MGPGSIRWADVVPPHQPIDRQSSLAGASSRAVCSDSTDGRPFHLPRYRAGRHAHVAGAPFATFPAKEPWRRLAATVPSSLVQ